LELRDHALADIAMHTARRIMDAKTNKNVQCYYGNYDFGSLAKSISVLLDQVIEDSEQLDQLPGISCSAYSQRSRAAKSPETKPAVAAPVTAPPEPQKQAPVLPAAPPVKESEKSTAEPPKPPAGDKKKKGTKKDSPKARLSQRKKLKRRLRARPRQK